MKVDAKGNVGGEAGASIAGFIIHEAVYSVRPDVHAIFHTHTRAGVAVGALECGLLANLAVRAPLSREGRLSRV